MLPASRRIIITVPESLLNELDGVSAAEDMNRSELVREAISHYLKDRRRQLFFEHMKKGYIEMATINLSIACDNLSLEEEALSRAIEKIME